MKEATPKDELRSFLMAPELVKEFIENLYKVLDIDRTGVFSKDDLMMFLGFFSDQCRLAKLNE